MNSVSGSVPLVIRIALSSLLFLVGVVKILHFLTPAKSLVALSAAERENAEVRKAPPALIWGTAATTLLLSIGCLFPGTVLALLENVRKGLRWMAGVMLGGPQSMQGAAERSEIGPAPFAPPAWAIALAVISVLLPGLLYVAWRVHSSGRRGLALGLSVALVVVMVGSAGIGSMVVDALSGRTYRETLRQWIRRSTPVSPGVVWGREGPVILYARPTLYREVEPGILYRRTIDVTRRGEVVPSEQINEFTIGRLTVKARPGGDLVVSGVPSSYEGVIITQEPLRIAGYLSGGALEARHGLALYLAPADHRRWREDLEKLWGSTNVRQRAASTIYLAWCILACAWGTGVFLNCLVRPVSSYVEKEEG